MVEVILCECVSKYKQRLLIDLSVSIRMFTFTAIIKLLTSKASLNACDHVNYECTSLMLLVLKAVHIFVETVISF